MLRALRKNNMHQRPHKQLIDPMKYIDPEPYRRAFPVK